MHIMTSNETVDLVRADHLDYENIAQWAEWVLRLLAAHARSGLPDCYQPAASFLYDFWPDLPWDEAGQQKVVSAMYVHPEYDEVITLFEERTGVMLREALASVRIGGKA